MTSVRGMVIEPASSLTNFLEMYSQTGVATATLQNLIGVYNSPQTTHLSLLNPVLSDRDRRQYKPETPDLMEGKSFHVHLFKKIASTVPGGLNSQTLVDFFVSQFTFWDGKDAEEDFRKATDYLVNCPNYPIIAVTALTFDTEEKKLEHQIVGAVSFMHDKNGSFIFTLCVLDQGRNNGLSLSPQYFEEPEESTSSDPPFLSATSSFRHKGLATFMLSLIQALSSTGYTKLHLDNTEVPHTIVCDEATESTSHHLYLQGRIESGSGYTFYLKIGFTLHQNQNDNRHCRDYKKECPVHKQKPPKHGYYIDDNLQRLLCMKRWIYNIYPPEASYRTLEGATDLWCLPGLQDDQYLSSALVIPPQTKSTMEYTNAPYCRLLECKFHINYTRVHYIDGPVPDFRLSPLPSDLSRQKHKPELLGAMMLSGQPVLASDHRRGLFRNLILHHTKEGLSGESMDAFSAVAAPLYLEGSLTFPADVEEMSLELRLNVAAFYYRMARFPVIPDELGFWSNVVIDEFKWLSKEWNLNEVGMQGLGIFQDFKKRRESSWGANFQAMGDRISMPGVNGDYQPVLWMDVMALQLLFSTHLRPVFIPHVYGVYTMYKSVSSGTMKYYVRPEVPDFGTIVELPGRKGTLGMFDPVSKDLPEGYTVVPLFSTDTLDFSYFSSTHPKHATDAQVEDMLCTYIPSHETMKYQKRKFFQQTLLLNSPQEIEKVPVQHCASQNLCQQRLGAPADIAAARCPLCLRALHLQCGMKHQKYSAGTTEYITCYLCYQRYGKAFDGDQDVSISRTPGVQKQLQQERDAAKKASIVAARVRAATAAEAASPVAQPATAATTVVTTTTAPPVTAAPPTAPPVAAAATTAPSVAAATAAATAALARDVAANLLATQKEAQSTEQARRGLVILPPTQQQIAESANVTFAAVAPSTRQQQNNNAVDARNPTFMYPSRQAKEVPAPRYRGTWLENMQLKTKRISEEHFAPQPVGNHVYSQAELDEKCRSVKSDQSQDFHSIICAAIELRDGLAADRLIVGKLRVGQHKPDGDRYTDQELVHLCCLLDRGRGFSITSSSKNAQRLVLEIESYDLHKTKNLEYHISRRMKPLTSKEMKFEVYTSYLKSYLSYFDPDLWMFVETQMFGPEMLTFRNHMASDMQDMYEQQGIRVRDPLMVTLPKSHKAVSTAVNFGETVGRAGYQPYCTDTYGSNLKKSHYDEKLTKSCNPKGFDEIPVARVSSHIAHTDMQIRGIRAEIKKKVLRWLGLQGDKYVSLPTQWVEDNFDEEIREEAIRRVQKKEQVLFVRIPPGDSRNDDPPDHLKHPLGLNMYYQGQIDNCLMGGFANAVAKMLGDETARKLLQLQIPMAGTEYWSMFVAHVNQSIPKHCLRKFSCANVLDWDDRTPIVVQLRSRNLSESHAITVYDGAIYDSSSRFILVKSLETLNWCSGEYGFDRHLRLYQLGLRQHIKSSGEKKRTRYS